MTPDSQRQSDFSRFNGSHFFHLWHNSAKSNVHSWQLNQSRKLRWN